MIISKCTKCTDNGDFMDLEIKNKTINDKQYNTIDIWINGVSINSISEIKKIKTCDEAYDMIAFITLDDIEHHVQRTSIVEVIGTFYDENWNQLSSEEIDFTTELLKQINNLEEL